MKPRIKVNLPLLQSRDEAEAALRDLALAVNKQRKLIADRDQQVLLLNKAFESPLAELDQKVATQTDALRAWAEANPDQFPKDRKSLQMSAGILGFRTGTPKLALLSRAWNWDKVLQAVQQWLPNFIRNKPEVDKEAILGQSDDLAEFLPRVGLKVVQDESFFIEPNLTDLDSRQTSEAA
jgi:phage host-nuclease inhibitor protein Gam